MSIFEAGGSKRRATHLIASAFCLLALGGGQPALAVNLIDPDNYDWGWIPGGEPTFPNECYGSGNDCLVDTDDNAAGKSNEGDNKLFDVWVPDGAGPFPVYVFAHGGGFTGGSKKRMVLSGPLLQADNVVYVNINYSLNGQTPAGILESIGDGVNCLNYLKANSAQYKINPDQIFVGGGSAGGVLFNDIVYKEQVTGIQGVWHWNLYEQAGQSVDLTDQQLLADVDLPVVNAHPDLYPTDNSHSAKLAFEHSEANWQAGSTGIFLNALREHESAIGYGSYSAMQQIWENGTWIKDSRDGTDTGATIPNLAEWVYANIATGPGPGTGVDFYDDYSSDELFNSAYTILSGNWFVRGAGTLDSNDKTVTGRAIVQETLGDHYTVSVKVKTVSKLNESATHQVPRLMFSYTSSASFYEAYVKSDGRVTLSRTVGGNKSNIGVVQIQGYDDSVRNDLEVFKDCSSIEVSVNGQLAISVQDTSLSGGSIGLRSLKTHARFDNLRILEH